MSRAVTIELPEDFIGPLMRSVQATKQPIEKLLLTALQFALPTLDGLSPELIAKLEELETLDDERLRQVLLESVTPATQKSIARLLRRQQSSSLIEAEENQLSQLQEEADLVMLRKARAAVLLRFRGHRLPTLSELRLLTATRE